MKKIILPEIGDDITSGVVISISKTEGEKISEGELLIELETDKAAFPVNSPFTGEIKNILVKEGQELKVGEVIAELIVSNVNFEANEKEKNIVEKSTLKKLELSTPPPIVEPVQKKVEVSSPLSPPRFNSTHSIHAGPATRKLARELGVDLAQVQGSKRGGRIASDDLKLFVKSQIGITSRGGFSSTKVIRALPDFKVFGETEVQPASNLRATIANHISYSYETIPHVHQGAEVNLMKIDQYQKEYKETFKKKGSSLSVTIFIIKSLAVALNKFPIFNSSYDSEKKIIHYKKYFNIGVAVDTPAGLIVPVIKNIDKLNLFEIGEKLMTLAKATRERTVKREDLKGACMTLSNLGGIGGTSFNPIINWPEVAILGVGPGYLKPVYIEEKWHPQNTLPMFLAYDHRVIDGADGARFVTYLKYLLENPETFFIGIEK